MNSYFYLVVIVVDLIQVALISRDGTAAWTVNHGTYAGEEEKSTPIKSVQKFSSICTYVNAMALEVLVILSISSWHPRASVSGIYSTPSAQPLPGTYESALWEYFPSIPCRSRPVPAPFYHPVRPHLQWSMCVAITGGRSHSALEQTQGTKLKVSKGLCKIRKANSGEIGRQYRWRV